MSIFVRGKKTLTQQGHRLAGFVLLVCGLGVTGLSLAFPEHSYMDTVNLISGVVMVLFAVRSIYIGFRHPAE